MPDLQATKSAIGVAVRKGDPSRIESARRAHAAAKLEQYVERVVAAAPPLTPEQRDRIASLLRGGAAV